MRPQQTSTVDLAVVGAGPAGSAAAAWAARHGHDVLLIDGATFPRDKTCGDGLTPRAVTELQLLGLGPWLDAHIRHGGLRMSGFGADIEVRWPGPSFPTAGSAAPRTELDDRIRQVAEDAGAQMMLGSKVVDVEHDSSGRVAAVVLADGSVVRCRTLIVADGARSTLGRRLGRQWHQETVYGVAARGYLASPRADEPWISSDLELRSVDGTVLPGYGWIFPLGNGEVNIGVGALATAKRPADGDQFKQRDQRHVFGLDASHALRHLLLGREQLRGCHGGQGFNEISFEDQAGAEQVYIHAQRDLDEVHMHGGTRMTPVGVGARNPAFDVTPAELVTAIITERGVFRPDQLAAAGAG